MGLAAQVGVWICRSDTGIRGTGDGDGCRLNRGRGENSRQDGKGGKGALHYSAGQENHEWDTNENELFYGRERRKVVHRETGINHLLYLR
jgi:hypothetical protein